VIKAKVVKKGRTFNKIRKSVKDIHQENVQIGYFAGQGQHTSGLSFPALMAIHEFGTDDIPKRPVFQITAFGAKPQKSSRVKSAIRNWSSNLAGRADAKLLLDTIGKYHQKELQSLFGDTSALASNRPTTIRIKGRDEPLVDSGELRDNLAYRNSIDEEIKK